MASSTRDLLHPLTTKSPEGVAQDPAHIPIFAGFATDESAGQQWRDMFTRLRRPSEVYTNERIGTWTGARPASSQPRTAGLR